MRLWFIFRKKRRLIFLILLVSVKLKNKATNNIKNNFDIFNYVIIKIKAMQIYEKNVTAVIKKSILENMDENLMKLKYNDGKISYAYLDTYEALNIKAEASSMLSKLNPEIENMVNYVSVPVGYFFTKKFMLTDGLKVPLRLTVYQAFDSEIVSDVSDYGINNQLYEVSLQIKMDIYIQIPFQEQIINYEDKILLSSGIINNEIPNYYFHIA
mgnify:CR=1 FL=1